MLAALILAVTAQQLKTVTFSHPCAHSSIVLEALGEELGVTMEPSGSINKDFFLVSFKDVEVDTALDKIAETLGASWTLEDGVYYLGRTKAEDIRNEALGREWFAEIIDEYILIAERTRVWTVKEATEKLRPHIRPDGSLDRSAVERSLGANGPFQELLDEFVRSIGSKELSQLTLNKLTKYRWRPREGERQIPPSLRASARRTATSVENFHRAFQGLGVSPLPEFDPLRAVRLAGVDRFSPDVWSIDVQATGTDIFVHIGGYGERRVWSSSITISNIKALDITTIEGLDTPFRPSLFAKAVLERRIQAASGVAHRLREEDDESDSILEWFQNGLETDPLHYLGGEAVLQICESSGFNIVAVLPDRLIEGFGVQMYVNRPLRDWLANFAASSIADVDPVNRWIGLKPVPKPSNTQRFDREKAAAFAMTTFEKGWPDIDSLAELATSCDGAYAFHFARGLSDVLQPIRSLGVRMIDPALYRLLRIYASLAPSAKQAAREGGARWSLSDLPVTTLSQLKESLAFSDLLEPIEHRSRREWPFTLTLGDYFAMRKPVNLPAETVLEVRIETARLFSTPDGQTARGFVIGQLMTAEETARGVYNTRGPGAPQGSADQFRNLAIVDAERLVIVLYRTDGTTLEAEIQSDSRNSETLYVPIGTLEGSEVDAYKKELRRLEEGGL